jgi:hypothetical protein
LPIENTPNEKIPIFVPNLWESRQIPYFSRQTDDSPLTRSLFRQKEWLFREKINFSAKLSSYSAKHINFSAKPAVFPPNPITVNPLLSAALTHSK